MTQSIRASTAISVVALGVSIGALVVALDVKRSAIPSADLIRQANENTDRMRSGTQARGIAQAVVFWIRNNGGVPPSAATWREDLIATDMIDRDMFRARGADVEQAFFYLEPTADQIASLDAGGGGDVVLVYEHPDLWGGEGGNVAYLDTSAEWVDGASYRALIERLGWGD